MKHAILLAACISALIVRAKICYAGSANPQIDLALRYIELVENFTPETVERNFSEAEKLLAGPYAEQFKKLILTAEAKLHKSEGRSRAFILDPKSLRVDLTQAGKQTVDVKGERTTMTGGVKQPSERISYRVIINSENLIEGAFVRLQPLKIGM